MVIDQALAKKQERLKHETIQTGSDHWLVIQHQIAIPENMHVSKFIHTEIKFRNIYVQSYTSVYVTKINGIRHEFEREKGKVHGKVWKEDK